MTIDDRKLTEEEAEKRMTEYVQAHWPEIKHDLLDICATMKEYENAESSNVATAIEKCSS